MLNYTMNHMIRDRRDPNVVEIREFVTNHGGIVSWHDSTARFIINSVFLMTNAKGTNNNAMFRIWNENGRLMANAIDLTKFFGIINNHSVREAIGKEWEMLTPRDRIVHVSAIVVHGSSYRDITIPLGRALSITSQEAQRRPKTQGKKKARTGLVKYN